MDFRLPAELTRRLAELDAFIEREIKPLQAQDDNKRFFDHRREYARTDFENGGVPRQEWEELLAEMRRRADAAGWLRYGLPEEIGGRDGTNLDMAVDPRAPRARRGWACTTTCRTRRRSSGTSRSRMMLREFGTRRAEGGVPGAA